MRRAPCPRGIVPTLTGVFLLATACPFLQRRVPYFSGVSLPAPARPGTDPFRPMALCPVAGRQTRSSFLWPRKVC
jgi:hypothetical protein